MAMRCFSPPDTFQSSLTHLCKEPHQEVGLQVIEMGESDGAKHFFFRGRYLTVANVFIDAVIEQDGVLRNDADGLTQGVEGQGIECLFPWMRILPP